MKHKVLTAILPLSILFMHLTFSHKNGQILSASLIGLLILFFYFLTFSFKFSPKTTLIYLFIYIYTALLGIFSDSYTEFIKSFILLTILLTMTYLSTSIKLPSRKIIDSSIRLTLLLLSIHSSLLFFQFIQANFFDSTVLFNPLGQQFTKWGPLGEPYLPEMYKIIKKTNGLYSEPSVAAWISSFGIALSLIHLKRRKEYQFYFYFCSLGALSTGSLSGFVNFVVILTVYAIIIKEKNIKRKITIISLSKFSILVFVTFFSFNFLLSEYSNKRFEEISHEGSSLYVRFVSPTLLFRDSIKDNFFGVPLGQENYILSKPYIIVNEHTATNPAQIQNSYYLIMVYFGIFGVIFVVYFLVVTARLIVRKNKSALLVIAVGLAISQSGGLWSPSYILLISYSIILTRDYNRNLSKNLSMQT